MIRLLFNNKNNKQRFFILIIVAAFAACKKEPTACFTTGKAEIVTTNPTYDTVWAVKCDASCSKKAEKYIWDCGWGCVGSFSSNGEPSSSTTTFTVPFRGTYKIELEVTNGNKNSIITHDVIIN